MMPLAEELGLVYARMSGLLLSEQTVQLALQLITSLALNTVDGAVGAGVTLVDATGHQESAAATSPLVLEADAIQYELGEGPCLTAWTTQETVRVDDLATDGRWPGWREVALPLGLRSSLSVPLVTDVNAFGAIKVYGQQAGVFDERIEEQLRRFAEQAAILLANVQSLEKAERLSTDLQVALRARNTIGLACGVLMERHRLTEEQAFLRLVDSARERQRELVVEAAQVVESVSPDPA